MYHYNSYILYCNKVIITFGGKMDDDSFDNIYFIDITDNNSICKESQLKLPMVGACHAIICNEKIVHILPSGHNKHFCIDVKYILPDFLL